MSKNFFMKYLPAIRKIKIAQKFMFDISSIPISTTISDEHLPQAGIWKGEGWESCRFMFVFYCIFF